MYMLYCACTYSFKASKLKQACVLQILRLLLVLHLGDGLDAMLEEGPHPTRTVVRFFRGPRRGQPRRGQPYVLITALQPAQGLHGARRLVVGGWSYLWLREPLCGRAAPLCLGEGK